VASATREDFQLLLLTLTAELLIRTCRCCLV